MKHILVLFAFVAELVVVGCVDSVAPADLPPTVVVEGYLYANQPIDSIVLTQTQPIDAYYSDSLSRITGALVTITVDGHAYTLLEKPGRPGAYTLPAESLIVRSEKQYTLSVHALNTTVTATTTVPDTFAMTTVSPDTIQWPLTISTLLGPPLAWTASLNRDAYAISMEALDTLIYQISGKDTVWNRRVQLPGQGERRNIRAQQLIRYILQLKAPQANITWDLFRWYGKHRLTVLAMDTNFVDFMQMQSVGGRTYQSQLNHITNGIGVFGSAAVQRQTVYLKE
jgi:hypothetical protein